MEEIPKAAARSLEVNLPEFTKWVRTTSSNRIILPLGGFADDPMIFYYCVWYAISHGKAVEVVSDD